MADVPQKTKKPGNPGKHADTLETIGSVASMLGSVIFGPGQGGEMLGAPFMQAAQSKRNSMKQAQLLDMLHSDPTLSGLATTADGLAQSGGIAKHIEGLINAGDTASAQKLIERQLLNQPTPQEQKIADLRMQQLEQSVAAGNPEAKKAEMQARADIMAKAQSELISQREEKDIRKQNNTNALKIVTDYKKLKDTDDSAKLQIERLLKNADKITTSALIATDPRTPDVAKAAASSFFTSDQDKQAIDAAKETHQALGSLVQAQVKSLSGANPSDGERRFIQGLQPSAYENIDAYKRQVKKVKFFTDYLTLRHKFSVMEALPAGTKGDAAAKVGITPAQLNDFVKLRKLFDQAPSEEDFFTSPDASALMKKLDIYNPMEGK